MPRRTGKQYLDTWWKPPEALSSGRTDETRV